MALPPCSFFAGSLRDSNPIKSTYGGPDKHLLQVKAHSALTGEATGPKDKQQALFRACLRQQKLQSLHKLTRKPGFRILLPLSPQHLAIRPHGRPLKHLIQVKALRALTGEATGPKDQQPTLFRACLR